MTSVEIRSAFLRFFESKGHTVIHSSSLIPKGDPTLLLNTAGMVQFKPYFLGEAVPPNPRLASCQKCFRTTDIESVGDATHLTFFEMLGNFSIGDYFKKEAINWAWEFLTQHLKLPLDRLWVTIYLDDDEAFNYWREIDVPEDRIKRFGEEFNFWGPAGDSGPCGPCSEIHYDFGEEFGCKKPDCGPNCDCGRFSEIWNLVFPQYNQDKQCKRTPLPRPNIDTGMGLERITAILEGKTSVYQSDLFTPLIQRVSELTGKKFGTDETTDNAIRIIAEHSRGITFLITDGVIPTNEGRGYVLRRLLRRAVLFSRRLGLEKPFLSEMAKATIDQMGHVYPELVRQKDFVLRIIEHEEARFNETLSTGLEILDGIMEEAGTKKEISGGEAFRLYDTYGFPVASTAEIAAARGFAVDKEGFEQEMAKQRERARSAHKFEVAPAIATGLREKLNVRSTPFTGYDRLEQETKILGILVGNELEEAIGEGQEAGLVLAETPFYAEMGGQMGDSGTISSPSGRFNVTNTIRLPSDIVIHQGRVVEGTIIAGETATAEVERERRLDIARNHTATHLLQAALREVLGEHIQQRGSLVAPDRLRFDFSHLSALTDEELRKVERVVNERIRRNLPVYDETMSHKKAVAEGAIALFDEKYGDTVRVLQIGKPRISAELCGGTHVGATGEIGYLHITGESSIGTGLRRIEAVTGRGAEALFEKQMTDWQEMAKTVGASPEEARDKVTGLVAELNSERKRLQALERALAEKTVDSLLSQAETIEGINVLAARVPPSRPEALREMSDLLRQRLKSAIIVLGTVYDNRPAFLAAVTPDLVAKGYDAGKLIKEVAGVTGGGGGGRPTLAQAGGKDKDKLDEALQMVRSLVSKGR